MTEWGRPKTAENPLGLVPTSRRLQRLFELAQWLGNTVVHGNEHHEASSRYRTTVEWKRWCSSLDLHIRRSP